MNQFKIVPVTEEYASRIRTSEVDDFGNEVISQIATGYGPCRVSLKPFRPEVDTRLLLSYNPFNVDNAFSQSGPIFIHKKEVKPYNDVHRFPPEIKADKENFPLTLIGYDQKQKMVFTKLVGDVDIDLLIPKIFRENSEVAYLHARNAEAGCFICKIVRI